MRTSWIPALLLGATAAATAQTTAPAGSLATQPGWEAGVQGARYHYEEPDFMRLTGNRVGFTGAYTITANRLFTRIDARYSYGSLKYEGSGTQNDVPDMIYETRAVAGTDIRLGGRAALSPFAGLGYRYLYNDLRGYATQGGTTFLGYRRYSHYVYAPLGLTLRFDAGNRWVLAPTLEYDVFLRGWQVSRLTDTGFAGITDATNHQKHGRGYRASVMVEKDHWAFGPWMHYWNIKDSDVQPIGGGAFGLEPANWTREYGLEIRYRF
jgi:hypothetical protein